MNWKNVAEEFAETAEYWRERFHRENFFTRSCCRDKDKEIDRLKRLVTQVSGIPAEYFDENNILEESAQKAYERDPYGRKERWI